MKRRGRKKRQGKRWIQRMHLKKGALHQQLGIPKDEPIPTHVLREAVKLGHRAQFALTARKFRRRK